MRKHFLLLLWLTLLPLALWAQTITISPNHAFTITYGDANPTLTNRSWVSMTASGGTTAQNNAFNSGTNSNAAKDQLLARLMLAQDYSTYNAGTYNYTLTHSGNDQFSYNFGGTVGTVTFTIVHSNGTGSRTMTINRANNSATVSLEDWAYGETPNTPSVTATNTDGTITYQYSANGYSGWSNTVPTEVGPWYVRATIAQSTNYNAVTTSATQFNINKAAVTVTLGNVTKEWKNPWPTLTTDDISPVVTGGTTNWNEVKGYLTWNQVEPIGNAGDQYAYTLDPFGTHPNYNITVSGSGAVVIEKNDDVLFNGGGDVATGNITYNGSDIALNPAAALTYEDTDGNSAGAVEYSLNGTDWSAQVPTGKNADTYTVYYRGAGDQNHIDNAGGSYTVVIDPYELVAGTDFTAPTAKTDGVYSGSAQDIAIAGEFIGKFAEELATAGAKFIYPTAEALPQQTNANDNYSFSWDIDLGTSTNFTYSTGATNVSGAKIAKAFITSADYTLPVVNPDLEPYNATNQNLHTALVWNVTPAPGEARYGRSDTPTQWPNTLRWRNDAGTWTISTAIIPDANHTFEAGTYLGTVDISGQTAYIVQNDLEVTIEPAEVTIASNGTVDTKVFDGTAQGLVAAAPTFTGVGGANVAGTVTYAWNDGEGDKTATTAAGVVATNAGEYAITYTFAPTSNNYKPIEEAQALEGAEAKAKIEQFTLYVGGNEVKGTIEDVYDLENEKPLISNSDFLNVEKIKEQFPAADADGIANAAAILDQLVAPVQTLDEIIANAKVATITVALKKNDVAPAPGAPMNYKIDEATLLSNAASLTLTAIEAAIQAAPAGYADLAYTGDDQELVETAATGYKAMGGTGTDPEKAKAIGKVVYSLEKEGTYTDDLTTIVGKDADEYEVFYKVELSTEATSIDRFYKYTADPLSIKVTIAQADNEITNLALEDWTYGEEANEPVAEAKFAAEGEPTFTYSDSETGTFTAEVPTNAGTWYVKASVAETTNWKAAEKTISFKIDQAKATITTAPAAKTLVYNREPQELVEAGVSNDGTVMYSLTGEATDFAEAIPEGTDAGEYEVYYMVKGDANHTDLVVAEPVVVTIAKADVTDIVKPAEINPNYTLTYNGYDQALVKPATFGDEFVKGEFKYFVGETAPDADSEDWSDAIPQAKNAGEYIVHTLFIPNDNHNEADVEPVTVTINKATIGYSLSNLTKDWDGELFAEEEISKLFTLSAGGDGTKLFGDDEYDKPFTLTLPEDYRDAGTYTFKQPKVEFKEGYPENYNVTFNGTAEVIINKVNLVEGEGKDYTAPGAIGGLGYIPEAKQNLVTDGSLISKYDEDYPNKDLAGKYYGGTILFATAEDGEYSEDVPTGTEAKDYEVWFKVAGDINHNETKPMKIENTIAPALLTADFLPEEYKTELPYKAAAYEPTDFIPALDGIDLNEGYEVYAEGELKDAGEYVIMFQGINNYAGEESKFEVTVKITPIDVIATAPKGVTKVYDGTTSLANAKIGEKALSNEDISFSGLISPDKIELPTELAMTTEGIKAGAKYAITVDPSKFAAANPNYNILSETIEGEVEITKAPAIKVGFDAVPTTWTKEFGEDDPELTGYTVKVTDGEFFDNIDDVLAATTAVRAEGENVGTYDVTLTIDATADVFANYEGVAFDETAATFEITKSSKTYTVSLANIEEIYNGEEFATAIEFTAEDLVIAGYTGDKAKFFTTMPTASIPEGAKTVGDYNITLAEGESQNFKFTFVPATFTIKPFNVTEATIESQKVQKGKELDVTKFTITAPEADADLFYVTAPGLVDMDDVVIGDAGVYPEGLVIAVDASVAANYTGLDKFTAELEIISAEAIVLADNEDCAPEAQEGVDVTFASRKINAGTWNVVALPFAASVPQISEAFGYAAVDILDETNANPKEIHFKVISSGYEDGKIPAYTPFIVKTSEDDGYKKENFDQVVFHNVNIEAGDGENHAVSDAAGNQFIGTFKAVTKIWGEKFRYMSKGAWYDATNYTESNPAKIGAFRGYIEMVEAGARIFIEEPDGTVTAIDAVSFNKEAAEGMYNLNGVKVNNLNRKGVYIKNGVKVIK